MPTNRKTRSPMRRLRLFGLLVATGVLVTFVHDYAYRRVDTGSGEYEFGGLLSHAGSDMLIVTLVVATVAALYTRSRE